MRITYDPAKRDAIVDDRGLDIARADEVFAKFHLTRKDEKHSAWEERFITVGLLDDDVIIVVWTPRSKERRIVTVWKANEKERSSYRRQREDSG